MILHLKDRDIRFAYDINSLLDLEDNFNIKLESLQNAVEDGAMKTFRALFWGGLIKHYPETTLREAGAIMTEYLQCDHTMEDVSNLVVESLIEGGFFPKEAIAKYRQMKETMTQKTTMIE